MASDAYNHVIKGVYALHMLSETDDEGAVGEAIRDSMDGPFRLLTPEEKEAAGQFSENLYTVLGSPKDGM